MRRRGGITGERAIVPRVAFALALLACSSRGADAQPTASPSPEGPPPPHGSFRDRDGAIRDVSEATAALRREREPDLVRAVVESTALLAVGVGWYWLNRKRNARDWDLDAWQARFDIDSYRYDNNEPRLNFSGHPLSGATYYGLGRANGLDVLSSAAISFAGSFLWEFAFEFRERVSINDTLVTPAAGVPFGEFLYRLGQYLAGAPCGGSRAHRAARWSLGFPIAAHDALDDRVPICGERSGDSLGFHPDFAHRFLLTLGYSGADPSGAPRTHTGNLRFEGMLAALPGYHMPGDHERFFTDAQITRLDARVSIGTGERAFDLRSEALLFGAHAQRLRSVRGHLRGVSGVLASGIAYHHRYDLYDDFEDLLAVVELPGLALDGTLFAPRARIDLRARANATFSGVHSFAYPIWEARNPDVRAKSVLRSQGYYYAWGFNQRLEATIRLRHLSFGAEVAFGFYDSREGLDRTQDEIDLDTEARDRSLEHETFLRLHLPRAFVLDARYAERWRSSRLEDIEHNVRLRRFEMGFGVEL